MGLNTASGLMEGARKKEVRVQRVRDLRERAQVIQTKMAYTPQFFGPRAFGSLFDFLRNNLGWEKEPVTQKLSRVELEKGHLFAYLPKELGNSEPEQLLASDQTDPKDAEGVRRAPHLFTYRFLQSRTNAVALFVTDVCENDEFFQDLKRNPERAAPHNLTPYVLIGEPGSDKGRFVSFYLRGNTSPWNVKVAYRTTRLNGLIATLTSLPSGTDLRSSQVVSDRLLNELVNATDYAIFHVFCDSYAIWCRERPPESLLVGPDLSEYDR
jgi:hypothetical protein